MGFQNCISCNFYIADNALYRIGSQHIAPLFSKSPSHRKRSGTYEYPVNPDDNDVGKPTPGPPTKRDQKLPSSNSENNKPKKEVIDSNTYSIPTSLVEILDSNTAYSTQTNITESNDYAVPTSLPVKEKAYENHVIETQVTMESPMGTEGKASQVSTSDMRMESGDYIYMSGCPDISEPSSSARESAASSYGTDEVKRN